MGVDGFCWGEWGGMVITVSHNVYNITRWTKILVGYYVDNPIQRVKLYNYILIVWREKFSSYVKKKKNVLFRFSLFFVFLFAFKRRQLNECLVL